MPDSTSEQPKTKVCTKCGTECPRTAKFFGSDKRRKDGLRSWCKTCRNKVKARWQAKNPDKNSKYNANWRAENSGKNRDKTRAKDARWRANNPDKRRAQGHRRRARERNADGNLTAADIERQRKAQKGKCYYASPECNGELTIEHLVPLARGGTSNPDNIVMACKYHNLSKGNKLPHEYGKGGRLL